VRLTDKRGSALTSLEFSSAPATTPLVRGAGKPAAQAKRWAKIYEDIEPAERREVLVGYALYKEGLLKDASARFDEFLLSRPRHLLGLFLGAPVALDSKEEEKALTRMSLAIDAAPDVARFWSMRADYFASRGRLDRALEDQAELEKRAPRSERTLRGKGRLYREKGWLDEACAVTEELAQLLPTDTPTVLGLARCARERGRHAEAAGLYRRALELEPTLFEALDGLAAIALDANDLAEGKALWERARALYPTRTQPLVELSAVAQRGREFDVASQHLRSAADLDPEYAYPFRKLGDVALEQGDEKGALAWWEQALERNPNDHALWERVEHHETDALAPHMAIVPKDRDIEAVIQDAPKVEVFPGASHVYLLDDEVAMVNVDGSVRRVVTMVVRIEDDQGRDLFSSVGMPGSGRVRVLRAFSVDKDGKRHEVSSIRDRRARYQDLAAGSILVLQFRHDEGRSRFLQNHWSSTWRFQQVSGQVERARWTAFVPKERNLNVYKRGNIQERVREEGAHRIYEWTASHVEPLRPEQQAPPAEDLVWSVVVSTVPGWEFIARWEWTMVEDALLQTSDVDTIVAKVVPKGASPAEKVEAIYRYAATDIRYEQDYAEPIEGVRPHQTSVIVERGYGDCKDKTVVMMTLLRAVGVEARFAMVSTATAGDAIEEVPSQQFNHAIVYVPAQPGIAEARFYDPTADTLDLGNLRWDDQGQRALVLWEGGHEFITIPFDNAKAERTTIDIDLELSGAPDKPSRARVVFETRGRWASGLRRQLRNEETGRKLVEGFGNGFLFVGADLESYEVSGIDDIVKPVRLVATYMVPNLIVADGQRLRVEVDEYLRLAAQQGRWPVRRHPLVLGPPSQNDVRVTLRAPAGFAFERATQPASLDEECLRFSLQSRVEQPTVAVVEYGVELRCPEVSTEAYPAYRNSLVGMARAFADKPILVPQSAQR
jgi:tetratricopeptide (TPR) repeat protein